MLFWIILAAVIVAADQICKLIVMTNLSATDSVHFLPGVIDFVYVKNTGAAFSILSESTVLLGIVSVLFCIGVGIYWYLKKPKHKLLKLSVSLLFAGALGNAIDRVVRGFVVDFISTAFMDFPVFNVADIAITVGAVLLVIYILFFDKEEVKDGENNTSDIKSE